jgi:hypothetical protein
MSGRAAYLVDMRIATAHLEGIAPYSQSRHYEVPKLGRATGAETESSKDYEARTWREMYMDAVHDCAYYENFVRCSA